MSKERYDDGDDAHQDKKSKSVAQTLHQIVEEGNLEKLQELLSVNAGVINDFDEFGATPLIIAVKTGNEKMVETLLSYPQIEVNKMGEGQNILSPLHYCGDGDKIEIARLLLSHPSINPNITYDDDDDVIPALSYIYRQGGLKVAGALLQKAETLPYTILRDSNEGQEVTILEDIFRAGDEVFLDLILEHPNTKFTTEGNGYRYMLPQISSLYHDVDVPDLPHQKRSQEREDMLSTVVNSKPFAQYLTYLAGRGTFEDERLDSEISFINNNLRELVVRNPEMTTLVKSLLGFVDDVSDPGLSRGADIAAQGLIDFALRNCDARGYVGGKSILLDLIDQAIKTDTAHDWGKKLLALKYKELSGQEPKSLIDGELEVNIARFTDEHRVNLEHEVDEQLGLVFHSEELPELNGLVLQYLGESTINWPEQE